MKQETNYIDLGLIKYDKAWDLQLKYHTNSVNKKSSVKGENYLIFCEHPNVYTLGKSGKDNNLLVNKEFLHSINAEYYKTDRGGDITYHGPGQLVGYPIIDLERMGIGVKEYIHRLEHCIIDILAEWEIEGMRLNGATGVWLDADKKGNQRKICAMGVKVSRSITMHGFALNVNTDLAYYNHINPCGFTDKGVTSFEKELGYKIEMEKIKASFLKYFSKNFQQTIIHTK